MLTQFRPLANVPPRNVRREIQSTTFYERFKLHRLNRPVDPKLLNQLIRSIDTKNCLADFPIIVSPKFDVIDGQHRLKAAEHLRVPIYYIISSITEMPDASHVNGAKGSWKTADHLHYYCQMGNENYLRLKAFMDKWPHIPLRAAINLTSNKFGNANDDATVVFVNGDYVCSSLNYAELVANASFDFSRWINFYRQQGFIFAVAKCLRNPNYNHKQMMQKMEYLSTRLVRCSRTTEYLQLLDEIYNHKVQTANRVWLSK